MYGRTYVFVPDKSKGFYEFVSNRNFWPPRHVNVCADVKTHAETLFDIFVQIYFKGLVMWSVWSTLILESLEGSRGRMALGTIGAVNPTENDW